jgi:trans-AT polyketide synthase/acyltransferase/oxidoreductase domain-containing protein
MPARTAAASTARTLGSAAFREAYGVDYAYVAGGMHHAIASVDLVARLAGAGVLSFLGTAGLDAACIEKSVLALHDRVGPAAPFGLNLTFSTSGACAEADIVDIALRTGVRVLEVSAYVQITDALVRYRLHGARADGDRAPQRLLAKVTRPDVARMFFEPPPPAIVERLLARGEITAAQAAAAALLPMADDVCAVGDSGGYTDMGALLALLPALRRLRDEAALALPGATAPVRVGAGGGIGAPPAAAAAFLLGADFVLTGSVNACTAESGLSARAKELLQDLDVHETTYAPSADLFELGGRVQVMKKGVLSHARANKLYDVWRTYDSWESVSPALRAQIEERYLRATFDEVYARARAATPADAPGTEPDPRGRMALVFRWYCDNALRLAVEGTPGREVDYQVWCGPALGAANQWLREAGLGAWQDRHVDEICRRLMDEASTIMGGGHR